MTFTSSLILAVNRLYSISAKSTTNVSIIAANIQQYPTKSISDCMLIKVGGIRKDAVSATVMLTISSSNSSNSNTITTTVLATKLSEYGYSSRSRYLQHQQLLPPNHRWLQIVLVARNKIPNGAEITFSQTFVKPTNAFYSSQQQKQQQQQQHQQLLL
ncbi:hypothetical protein ACTFIU_008144 [Dictyostelium citrinum]